MDYEEIVPAPGQIKATLRVLHSLAGGHADAVTNGHQEIIVPAWLAQKYRESLTQVADEAPKRRARRTKKEMEEQ